MKTSSLGAALLATLAALAPSLSLGAASSPAPPRHVTVSCEPDDATGGVVAAFDAAVAAEGSRRLSVAADSPSYAASARVREVADTRERITNRPRVVSIGGATLPFFHGPRATPGSLALMTRAEGMRALAAFTATVGPLLAGLALNQSASLTSLEATANLYDQTSEVVEKPMSADNRDEIFGLQRHTIKNLALRVATGDDLVAQPLALSDTQLLELCGRDAAALQLARALFVEDFHDVAQYNDPARPDKYVPKVVGLFCVHAESHKLLPIEIRLLDTKLAYTPFDTQDEWTLAKIALETASASFHHVGHFALTHAVTIPLRVEMMRTMSDAHPARALVQRHVFADFGVEMLVDLLLLNTSTALDVTYGWGATGATRFLWDLTQRGLYVKDQAFHADVRARGLDQIPGHKYVTYGTLYHNAIACFLDAYLGVYYASDAAVRDDVELQRWAKASNTIPHVRDFPTSFETKAQLNELLVHLVFTSCVQHHTMNGAATWHGVSVPYSFAALWKPLPTTKSAPIEDLRAFTTPSAVLPRALALESGFVRRVPISESIWNTYSVEPFASEPALQPAIRVFQAALQTIDDIMVTREAGAEWPFLLLRPKDLPHYTCV